MGKIISGFNNKIKFTRIVLIVTTLCITFLMSACDTKSNGTEYKVYYRNSDGDKLVVLKHNSDTTDTVLLIEELLNVMKNVPKKNDYLSVFPENVKVLKTELNHSCMNIYFSSEFYNMTSEVMILFRAAVVNTVTQFEQIEYVQFFVNDAPALNKDGTMMGLMTQADFIDDSDDDMKKVEWKEVSLYYANKNGDKLIESREYIAYSKSDSVERMIVEQLMSGTSDSDKMSTLPKELKLLGVSVNNGVCYVNFDSIFMTGMVNVRNEIPVYSVVNSLCSLPDIDSVRIMINGDSSKLYRESISLDTNFNFNSAIVEQ